MTKIEQKIPEGWSIKKIIDVCPLQRGFDLPEQNIKKGNYPIVYSNGIKGTHNEYKATAPGVVMGRSGTIGKVTYIEQNYWPHNTSLWVTDFKDNIPKFIFYKLQNLNYAKFNSGSGVPTLNRNDVHIEKILLPPLPEQEKIAEILSCWDNGIEKLSALIKKKKIQKKALMQQLLTGKHRLKGFKEPWIDVDLASILQYEQPSKYLVDEVLTYNKNKIPVLTANKAFILGSTNDTEGVYNKGDCIIFDDFTTDIKYVDFPFKIKSSAIKILTPLKAETNLKFVFEQMKRIKYPLGGHKRYYLSEFQYLPISLPCPAEQKAIAEILSKADEEIELLNKKLEAFKQEKKALMQQLLTGKIRVKVN